MIKMDLYPLLLERHIDQRLWGGQKLAPFLGLPKPYPERIAESWQVYDDNRVLNGPLAGRSLAELSEQFGAELLGTISPRRYGSSFPLLAKFIDARQDLSIQVHPDDEYALRVEADLGFLGKNEAWYILDAELGAELYYHLARPVTREEFRAAVEEHSLASLLNRRTVYAGDVIYVPAGTIHTIGAGTMLFEIQQKSDLTYRVYDYGRPRPLHLDKALDVIRFDDPPPPPVRPLPFSWDGRRTLLIAAPHFALEKWEVSQPLEAATRPTSLEILTLLSGRGELRWDQGSLHLETGASVILPAVLGQYRLIPGPALSPEQTLTPGQTLSLLRCTVPDLENDIIRPLRTLGYGKSQIAGVVMGR